DGGFRTHWPPPDRWCRGRGNPQVRFVLSAITAPVSKMPSNSRRGLRTAVTMGAVLSVTVTMAACGGNKNRPRLAYEERPVELLYNTGYERLQSRRWADAVDYFQEVERQHPYSEWSRRAILMQIYAYYQ